MKYIKLFEDSFEDGDLKYLIELGIIEDPKLAAERAIEQSSFDLMYPEVELDLEKGLMAISITPDRDDFPDLEDSIGIDFDLEENPAIFLNIKLEVDFLSGVRRFKIGIRDKEFNITDHEEIVLDPDEQFVISDPDFAENTVFALDSLLNDGPIQGGRHLTELYSLIHQVYDRNRAAWHTRTGRDLDDSHERR
jgi:hypothetical protein